MWEVIVWFWNYLCPEQTPSDDPPPIRDASPKRKTTKKAAPKKPAAKKAKAPGRKKALVFTDEEVRERMREALTGEVIQKCLDTIRATVSSEEEGLQLYNTEPMLNILEEIFPLGFDTFTKPHDYIPKAYVDLPTFTNYFSLIRKAYPNPVSGRYATVSYTTRFVCKFTDNAERSAFLVYFAGEINKLLAKPIFTIRNDSAQVD